MARDSADEIDNEVMKNTPSLEQLLQDKRTEIAAKKSQGAGPKTLAPMKEAAAVLERFIEYSKKGQLGHVG